MSQSTALDAQERAEEARRLAQLELMKAAVWFAKTWKFNARNISGSAAKALTTLLEKARMFDLKADEEWAAEVAYLRSLVEEAFLELGGQRTEGTRIELEQRMAKALDLV